MTAIMSFLGLLCTLLNSCTIKNQSKKVSEKVEKLENLLKDKGSFQMRDGENIPLLNCEPPPPPSYQQSEGLQRNNEDQREPLPPQSHQSYFTPPYYSPV